MDDVTIYVDDSELGPALHAWTENMVRALAEGVNKATHALGEHIQSDKLSGQVLHIRTAALIESVRQAMAEVDGAHIEGSTIVGGDGVPYAHIHEYGGFIHAKNAPYLVFEVEPGKWVRTVSVDMPERPFARPSAQEMASQIRDILGAALEGVHA